jgi:hypothetical protein
MRLLYGFPMRSGKRAHASDVLEEFEDAVLERDLDARGGPENCTVARPLSWPSRNCRVRALRAGAVNARRPRGTRGRSAAQSIDGAEHSGILKRVMAAVHIVNQNRRRSPAIICGQNRAHRGPSERRRSPTNTTPRGSETDTQAVV